MEKKNLFVRDCQPEQKKKLKKINLCPGFPTPNKGEKLKK